MTDPIGAGYLAAGLTNVLGVLLFSKAFTNRELAALFPEAFSRFGLLAVMLWGLAYISVRRRWRELRWLAGVFTVEKLAYGVSWLWWLSSHHADMPALWRSAPLTAAFYAIYGAVDFGYMLLFAWAFAQAER